MDIKTSQTSVQKEKEVKDLHSTTKQKLWIGSYILSAIVCLILYFLFRLKAFNIIGSYQKIVLSILLAAACSFGVLVLGRIVQSVLTPKQFYIMLFD